MKKILLFPGCIYKNDLPDLLQKYLSLLTNIGVNINLFEDSICCGYVFRILGRTELFRENADKLVKKINSLNPDTIINLCPTCNRHFEKHLKRDCGLNTNIETYHISKFLLQYEQLILPAQKKKGIIAYQDSCYLGRRSGDYDSPRQLIRKLGYELRDGEKSREFSVCCGYSGLVPVYHPEISSITGTSKMDYFKSSGVDYVVTNCPRCYIGLKKNNTTKLKVLDFIELFSK
ncbi:MAG: (Fe-S)-binding protein [bacterium]